VKQQLGETPTPKTFVGEQIATTESPITPPALPNLPIVGPDAGELWDPNKAVDKLKSGVMHKVRKQEAQKRRKERPQKPPLPILGVRTSSAGPSSSLITPEIQIDEGTTPQ